MTSLVLLEFDARASSSRRAARSPPPRPWAKCMCWSPAPNLGNATAAAAKLPGVTKVLVADNPALDHLLAEPTAALLVAWPRPIRICWRPRPRSARTSCRASPHCWIVQPISDIAEVVDADTFVRPIYAGNGLATVKSSDAKKIITVRAASFDPVAADGGSAATENVRVGDMPGLSKFVSAELSKSERPELTAARVVISGGRGMQNGENFKLIEPIADKLRCRGRCVACGCRCRLRAQ